VGLDLNLWIFLSEARQGRGWRTVQIHIKERVDVISSTLTDVSLGAFVPLRVLKHCVFR